mmetsp:Transcript_575/g.1331  ORF Transcript_575/g.1331 Transcript_575/m.1331 type:complete len:218 (+) Transcript_575:786-1439(+)
MRLSLLGRSFCRCVHLCHDACGEYGRDVVLEVDLEPIVDPPVEVDAQARDAHDGSVDAHERLLQAAVEVAACIARADDHPPGDREIAVEPSEPQTPAVGLAIHGEASCLGLLGHGLELRARAVGVRADDSETAAGAVFSPDGEGHDGRGIAGEEVLPMRLEVIPDRPLAESDESLAGEARRRHLRRVEGRPSSVQEVNQAFSGPGSTRIAVCHRNTT